MTHNFASQYFRRRLKSVPTSCSINQRCMSLKKKNQSASLQSRLPISNIGLTSLLVNLSPFLLPPVPLIEMDSVTYTKCSTSAKRCDPTTFVLLLMLSFPTVLSGDKSNRRVVMPRDTRKASRARSQHTG